MEITPPGDVRPAFEKDLELIRKTIDGQWGDGYSKDVIPEGKIILLNNIPYIDRMDEVIMDGRVIGAIRYNPEKKLKNESPFEFILRPWERLPRPEKGYAVVDDGAVEPIMNGGSVLTPGILEADEDIEEGDEVIVTDKEGDIVTSGSSRLSGKELEEKGYGKGIKNRWRVSDFEPSEGSKKWDKILEANEKLIQDRVDKAKEFIRKQAEDHEEPVAVAYSGGKDSLATLLLTLDAGLEPDMLFVDTGIELPETKTNVEKTAERYDLDLLQKRVEGGYWDNVEHFGPSARDYRWCCKTCKLGPTARLIQENYEDGVLSFIGQRRYESSQRMKQGSTWSNPWVPGQKSASPIQEWTALHVWMYLFSKGAEWNPLYEKGFERIGCWVCPASDLSELEIIQQEYDFYSRFEDTLDEYMEKNDLPEVWKELGLWRWLDVPEKIEDMLEEYGKKDEIKEAKTVAEQEQNISELLKNPRTRNLLNALVDPERIDFGKLESEGSEIDGIEREDIYDMHRKALYCRECGVCLARCDQDALYFDDGIKIDEERCVHCGECLGKCPVVTFRSRVSP